MVIKRNWKPRGQNVVGEATIQQTSSSEDSNSSWQTMSSSATSNQQSRSTVSNGRVSSSVGNDEMAATVWKTLKNRYNGRNSKDQTDLEIAYNSIEIMRINIQDSFDREIDGIVKKYIQTFFKPAIKNIKENLNSSILSDDYYLNISCDLLEHTKCQYASQTVANDSMDSSATKVEMDCVQNSPLVNNVPCKRKDTSSSDDENASSIASPKSSPTKKMPRIPPNHTIIRIQTKMPAKWDVSSLTTDTLFVLDYKANLALGLIDDSSNEKWASHRPDLVRYQADNIDKEWLIHKRILSPSNRHLRVLLMLMDDILRIAKEEKYQAHGNLRLDDLTGFKLPEFMLQKMRTILQEAQHNGKNTNLTAMTAPASTVTKAMALPTTSIKTAVVPKVITTPPVPMTPVKVSISVTPVKSPATVRTVTVGTPSNPIVVRIPSTTTVVAHPICNTNRKPIAIAATTPAATKHGQMLQVSSASTTPSVTTIVRALSSPSVKASLKSAIGKPAQLPSLAKPLVNSTTVKPSLSATHATLSALLANSSSECVIHVKSKKMASTKKAND